MKTRLHEESFELYSTRRQCKPSCNVVPETHQCTIPSCKLVISAISIVVHIHRVERTFSLFVREGTPSSHRRTIKSPLPSFPHFHLPPNLDDPPIIARGSCNKLWFARVSRLSVDFTLSLIYIYIRMYILHCAFLSIRHCTSRRNLLRTYHLGAIAELGCFISLSSVCFS